MFVNKGPGNSLFPGPFHLFPIHPGFVAVDLINTSIKALLTGLSPFNVTPLFMKTQFNTAFH